MISIFDMEIKDFQIKQGDVKVSADELNNLMLILESYHKIFHDSLSNYDDNQQTIIGKGLMYTEYFQNKYIVLGDLRQKEREYYTLLSQLNNTSVTDEHERQLKEKEKATIEANYLDIRSKRQDLQNELNVQQVSRNNLLK